MSLDSKHCVQLHDYYNTTGQRWYGSKWQGRGIWEWLGSRNHKVWKLTMYFKGVKAGTCKQWGDDYQILIVKASTLDEWKIGDTTI